MIRSLLLLAILPLAVSLPKDDLAPSAIGMSNVTLYSGYLNVKKPGKQIHYMFVQAEVDPDAAPLTLWLNGGPGCSSLIGLIHQIRPYLVGNRYKLGDALNKNDYSWHKISNLLFLESPATVGFSSDKDKSQPWTDEETAQDAFAALKDFLFVKATEFSNRTLFIQGEIYAGKYIPDLKNLILNNNMTESILVGNCVMDFIDSSLDKSQIQYIIDYQLVSNRMDTIYERDCFRTSTHPDACSSGINLTSITHTSTIQQLYKHADIYETCQDATTEGLRLKEALSSQNGSQVRGSHCPEGREYVGVKPILLPSQQRGILPYSLEHQQKEVRPQRFFPYRWHQPVSDLREKLRGMLPYKVLGSFKPARERNNQGELVIQTEILPASSKSLIDLCGSFEETKLNQPEAVVRSTIQIPIGKTSLYLSLVANNNENSFCFILMEGGHRMKIGSSVQKEWFCGINQCHSSTGRSYAKEAGRQ